METNKLTISIASSSQHKIKEIQEIFGGSSSNFSIDIHSILGLNIQEPDEPYASFMQNAVHKAKYYSSFTKHPTLSEDSGLCIETLDNFPGVKTKDFMLESGSLTNAFSRLEAMLIGKNNHAAYFVCAAALYFPSTEQLLTFEGVCNGIISFPARGDQGFGFDPIFIPDGYNQTNAELGSIVKNVIGHRANAMRGIYTQLLGIYGS